MDKLKNPPVAVALFQLKYKGGDISLKDFKKFDHILKETLPNRRDNIHVGLNFAGTSIPLGKSQLSATSDAKIEAYIYQSVDQKTRLELSEGTITYIDEHKYEGCEGDQPWDFFGRNDAKAETPVLWAPHAKS